MTEGIDSWTQDIHVGDAARTMRELPESSVHSVVTSPPYFGLRDYGVDGQVGLEDSLDEYIQTLVDVGEAVRRVLRPDGSWWLNLGDSYCTRRRARKSGSEQGIANSDTGRDNSDYSPDGDDDAQYHNASLQDHGHNFVDKDKMLVPHRVAIALQEDGWVVRNDVTWVKPNPMPQSVKDRLNTTTEQVFYLRPQPDGWFDLDAIREPYSEETIETHRPGYGWSDENKNARDESAFNTDQDRSDALHPAGKNPGDVFEIPTKPYPDAHFAVYPPELVRKPIKATCPPEVCAECGAPYQRERETVDRPDRRDRDAPRRQYDGNPDSHNNRTSWVGMPKDVVDEWWEQTCDCDTDATEPGIVLDPFAGAGTTALVAKELGRRFVGIDLNPEYVAMAQKRVGVTVDEPERLLDDDETSLTAFADGGSIHEG